MGQADCATAPPVAMMPITDTPAINCVMRVMIAFIRSGLRLTQTIGRARRSMCEEHHQERQTLGVGVAASWHRRSLSRRAPCFPETEGPAPMTTRGPLHRDGNGSLQEFLAVGP